MITEVHSSKLARPMVCAGYLSFEGLHEPEANEAAKEGTAAGELLERMILELPIGPQARNGVYFDDDMRFYLTPIANEICGMSDSGDVLCEQRIDWQTRSGVWIRGRYDASFVHKGKLYIDDLKYGWGIVEAFENWQLLAYAIGEVIRRGIAFDKIVMRIHQPRPHHEQGPTREWEISYNELLVYKEKIEARFEQIANGLRTLTTGKQCKYCNAAAEACPAFNRAFYRALEITTEFTQDQIDETELSRQLDHVRNAQEVLKIKLDSINELAVARIKQGKIIPGYITESSYGDRKWKAGVSAASIEMLTGKKITETVLLSPAKAEKAGIHKDFVNQLVERRFLGQKLVKKDASDIGNKIFGKDAPSVKS